MVHYSPDDCVVITLMNFMSSHFSPGNTDKWIYVIHCAVKSDNSVGV